MASWQAHEEDGEAATLDLEGRIAVVTGAGSGIGRATALGFGRAHAAVVAADLDPSALEETVGLLDGMGAKTASCPADVRQRVDVDRVVQMALETFGRIDVMANVAGIMHRGDVLSLDDEAIDRIMGVNFLGVLYGCQSAGRIMEEQGRGSIINIASAAIDNPAPGIGLYGVSKAAVTMLSKTLAAELGPKGVRVNVIAPGIVETNFSRPSFTAADGSIDPEALQRYRDRAATIAPLGRVGRARDVADTALFLASDASAFITGQIIRPNGGAFMPW